jgi:hypothetical protein
MLNYTAILATLNCPATVDKIRKSIFNVSKLKYNCSHVTNCKGHSFLGVRLRDGQLQITDRKGCDVTQLIVQAARQIKLNNNKA